jgi:hypothetical protein
MRLTEFWRRMDDAFGPHAQFLARDQVLGELGNRTVVQALEDGEVVKDVWRGVCQATQLPAAKR